MQAKKAKKGGKTYNIIQKAKYLKKREEEKKIKEYAERQIQD